jgi:hypothetical protein
MTERGALVIPAHINVPNSGMLMGRTGPPLVAMVKDPNLHAVALTPSATCDNEQEQLLKGNKPYDRVHPLAIIHSDDIVHPNQLRTDGATTWFKVSSPRAESLKLAVRTPQTRVATSEPPHPPRSLLKNISWTGGFLDGVTIPISSDLTAIIGGRGTGKSTVVESLRYALGLEPLGKDASADSKAIIEKVLRSGTIVRVEVEAVSPSPHRYTIERVVPKAPVVLDSSGTPTSQRALDVAGLVEVFGQHELAELASNPKSVADMLRRFTGSSGAAEDLIETQRSLAENRAQIQAAEEARAKLKDELADIPRLSEQVEQYEQTDVALRSADMKRLTQEDAVFTEGIRRTREASLAVIEFSNPRLTTALASEFERLEDSPQIETLNRVHSATLGLAAELRHLAAQAAGAVSAAELEIEAAKASWDASVKDEREGHDEVLRQLHEEGLEPDKYLDTTKALSKLKAKEPQLDSNTTTLRGLLDQRTRLLTDLATNERQQVKKLHEAVRAANNAASGVVIVLPIAAQIAATSRTCSTHTSLDIVRRFTRLLIHSSSQQRHL